MNVVLLEDVNRLGSVGDEVIVKDGYARNFLIPKNLAVESTPAAMQIIKKKRKEKELADLKIKEGCAGLAEKLKEISPTISMESGEEDKLFGSVTSEMIAESLIAEGIEIDKRKIELEEPIKKLGVYDIDIKLHPEVKVQMRVWVVKK